MPSILKLSAAIALIALSSLQPVASSSLAARAHGKRLTVPKTSPKSATTLETQAFPQQSGIEATEGKSTTPASKKSTKTAGEKSPAKAALNTPKPKSTTKGSGDKTSKKSASRDSAEEVAANLNAASSDVVEEPETENGSTEEVKAY